MMLMFIPARSVTVKRRIMPLAVLGALMLLVACAASPKPALVSPNAPITDVPGLPRVLLWASTTPTAPGYAASPETIAQYNAAAARIMQQRHIPIDDLNALVAPKREKLQLPDGCHYKPKGYNVIAKPVAKSINAELASAETKKGQEK
jgi:hypothetical protein